MKLTDLEILTENDKFCVENLWKNAVREIRSNLYTWIRVRIHSFIQLACHNSFLLYKQAANVAQTEEATTTTTNLFIDKFRCKRKSWEQRKTTREFFFRPQKAQNTKAKKKQQMDGMGCEWVSEWGWCGNCESNVRGCFGKFTQKLNAHNIIFFSLSLSALLVVFSLFLLVFAWRRVNIAAFVLFATSHCFFACVCVWGVSGMRPVLWGDTITEYYKN